MATLATNLKYRQEREVDRYLVKQLEMIGVATIKMQFGMGWPDRLILLGNGMVDFAECKALGKKMKPLQESVAKKLRRLGYRVILIDSIDKVDQYVREKRDAQLSATRD